MICVNIKLLKIAPRVCVLFKQSNFGILVYMVPSHLGMHTETEKNTPIRVNILLTINFQLFDVDCWFKGCFQVSSFLLFLIGIKQTENNKNNDQKKKEEVCNHHTTLGIFSAFEILLHYSEILFTCLTQLMKIENKLNNCQDVLKHNIFSKQYSERQVFRDMQ